MPLFLNGKHILLGVTGSIAAYKSADLVRRLREAGAVVRVVMTESAKQFITPLTMQAVSGYPVHDDLFDLQAEAAMGHIELARWADLVLIAPATADLMARFVQGHASDLLTAICLATKAPIAIAPAMNQGMWQHPSTQANVLSLQQKKMHVIGPGEGSQACGEVGPGRMLEPMAIVETVDALFATGLLAGKKVLVTAGPTQEAIDPIRFVSNGSTGKMGYALSEAAREAGAHVTLITGPTSLMKPLHVDCVSVTTAQQMYDEVMKQVEDYDVLLAVAAVSDYRPETIAPEKMHKTDEAVSLPLIRNPDIVLSVAALTKKPFIVGFAAETTDVIDQARKKMQRKQMNMMIANRVGNGLGTGSDDNEVTVMTRTETIGLPKMPKSSLARQLIAILAEEMKKESP